VYVAEPAWARSRLFFVVPPGSFPPAQSYPLSNRVCFAAQPQARKRFRYVLLTSARCLSPIASQPHSTVASQSHSTSALHICAPQSSQLSQSLRASVPASSCHGRMPSSRVSLYSATVAPARKRFAYAFARQPDACHKLHLNPTAHLRSTIQPALALRLVLLFGHLPATVVSPPGCPCTPQLWP
jgi:hypothetical protein